MKSQEALLNKASAVTKATSAEAGTASLIGTHEEESFGCEETLDDKMKNNEASAQKFQPSKAGSEEIKAGKPQGRQGEFADIFKVLRKRNFN